MLRRAERVHVSHHPGWFTNQGKIRLQIGTKVYTLPSKVHRDEFQANIDRSASYPSFVGRLGERSYWLYRDKYFWDNDGLTPEQVYALLVTRDQRETARISRAKTMVAMSQQPARTVRGAIPDDIRQFVWQRDGGCCRHCNSNVELQFDHVIPISVGGATSVENLQILCGPCNRRKGASV